MPATPKSGQVPLFSHSHHKNDRNRHHRQTPHCHALPKHGQRLAEKILHPDELAQLPAQKDPVRYLALRWAAKEALGKAFGTGLRAPLVMPAICLSKSALGAPAFAPTVVVQTMQTARHIAQIHLSLSDEHDYAVAFVWCEAAR